MVEKIEEGSSGVAGDDMLIVDEMIVEDASRFRTRWTDLLRAVRA
jgi:hypothetical protein